jgi:hypothetical protein
MLETLTAGEVVIIAGLVLGAVAYQGVASWKAERTAKTVYHENHQDNEIKNIKTEIGHLKNKSD